MPDNLMTDQRPFTVRQNAPRPPLWLPEGSIRAILAMAVFGSLLSTLVVVRQEVDDSFWLLWMLNYAILAYYFAFRQNAPISSSSQEPAAASATMRPLGLPRGTVRWLLLLAFFSTCVLFIYRWFAERHPFWQDRAFFPMLSLGGFFLGRLLAYSYRHRSGPFPSALQTLEHVKAAVALLCASVIVLIMPLEVPLPASPQLYRFAIVFIFFYFGAR